MSRTPAPAALLLVGHGSHYSLDSSQPVHALARAARALGEFAEVRVAFWKEEPFLHHAFDLIESGTVLVVPVFASLGYFTDRVVPRELRLDGPVTVRDGRRIYYLTPIGSLPEMAGIVLDRAREAVETRGDSSETTLVVLGHGTQEHGGSGGTTYDLATRLGDGRFARVVPAFLDQHPTLLDVLAEVDTRGVVVVPFFMSEGWHVGTTIRRDLARAGLAGDAPPSDRWIAYTKPVGTHPDVCAAVMGSARDAWAKLNEGVHLVPTDQMPSGPASVEGAREWFIRWIRAVDAPRSLLQTVVWADTNGRFEVRHELDAGAPMAALRTVTDPDAALDLARMTEDGRPRPLKTSPDLQRGWRFVGLDEGGLWEVYGHLYPAAPVHAFLHALGELRVVDFGVAAGRQTGMYGEVARLQGSALTVLVERRCGSGCLRVPVWHASARGTDPFAARARSEFPIPCNEPCSLLISEARATLDPSGTPG